MPRRRDHRLVATLESELDHFGLIGPRRAQHYTARAVLDRVLRGRHMDNVQFRREADLVELEPDIAVTVRIRRMAPLSRAERMSQEPSDPKSNPIQI